MLYTKEIPRLKFFRKHDMTSLSCVQNSTENVETALVAIMTDLQDELQQEDENTVSHSSSYFEHATEFKGLLARLISNNDDYGAELRRNKIVRTRYFSPHQI